MTIISDIPEKINSAPALTGPETTPADHAEQAPQAGGTPLFSKDHKLTVHFFKNHNPELRILRYRRQAEARRLLPDSRVAWCARKVGADPATHRIPDNLEIKQSVASGNYYTGGHWSCNLQLCPVCQARRAGVFLARLLAALEADPVRFAYGMDTLTASSRGQTAAEFIPAFKRAVERFNSGRWWMNFRDRWHIRGYVTGQDFTQGDAGPHYHMHRLLIADRGGFYVKRPSVQALRADDLLAAFWSDWREFWVASHFGESIVSKMWAEAAARWRACCEAEHLIASLDHGYHIEGGNPKIARYIAKMALEVTQSANKQGKGGRTLGELLDASAQGDRQAGRYWTEAVAALSGTATLKASRGLWAMLGEPEPTEAEIAAGDQSDIDRLIAMLPISEWYAVLKQDRREDYFAALAQNSLTALQSFADDLGILLIAPSAENAVAGFIDSQGGNYKLINVDLDALISFEDFDF
jgi:hypothetical protein